MTYVRMALKNLVRRKKRSFMLGGAIIFGIIIITLVNGFSASFLKNIAGNFSDFMGGHLFIGRQEKLASGKIVSVIRDDTALLNVIAKEKKYILTMTRRSTLTGALIAGRENISVKIEGIDWEEESNFQNRVLLKAGTWDDIKKSRKSIILTESNVKRLNISLNDDVLCKVETATGQLNVVEFVLKGIISEAGLLGALSAYAPVAIVNEALDIEPGAYNSLNLFLNNYGDIDRTAAALLKEFKENNLEVSPVKTNQDALLDEAAVQWEGEKYTLLNINDIMSQVRSMVDGLNIAAFVILAILVTIILVGVSNTYRMILFERVREIGTMRSLGMQRSGVRRLFYLEALFLCLGSVLAGIAAGFLLLWGISCIDFGLESPLSFFMKNGHISFEINAFYTLLAAAFVLVTILLTVGFPARKAARLNPAAALGKHY